MRDVAIRLRLVTPPLLLTLLAVPASAMDVTGNWRFGFSSGFGIFEQNVTLVQTGSTLTAGIYTGTIDPESGVFALAATRHCATLENPEGADVPIAIDGTFAPDGNSIASGTFNDVAQMGRSCIAVSGGVGGFRLGASTTSTSVTSSTSTTSTTSPLPSTTTTLISTTTSTTLPTDRLSLKSLKLIAPADARQKRLVIDSRDGDIDGGLGDGSVDDPTLHGGALRVRMPGDDDSYELPAANWTRNAGGYRYRDTRQLAGPITGVDVRPGRQIKITGKGPGLGHELAVDQGAVDVFLTLGARAVCMGTFGGTNRFRPGKLTSKNAGAPSSCGW